MSIEIESFLGQIDEFMTVTAQYRHSPSEYSAFSACLHSSLIKNYEFLQFAYSNAEFEGHFFALGTLRGITEDLIVLRFVSKLESQKRDKLLAGLQLIEMYKRITQQMAFFGKYRPFQPVLGWTGETPSFDNVKDEVQTIWRESGWTNFKVKMGGEIMPPVRQLAEKLPSGTLDLLYDFIYRLTSSTVHFSSQSLLRLGWGKIDDERNMSGTISVKHIAPYYMKFCRIYGALLFCLYFEFFSQDIAPTTAVESVIMSVREAILKDNRWPEMITFEEMNKEVPQFYQEQPALYITMHAAVIERFRQGFMSE